MMMMVMMMMIREGNLRPRPDMTRTHHRMSAPALVAFGRP
jgi:hypothetical protein